MKAIFIGAAPNIERDDVTLALNLLVQPWNWHKSSDVREFEEALKPYFFSNAYVFAFDSARSALFVLLKSLNLKPEDEVILPAFLCYVVANAVIAAGAKPVYADVGRDYNLSLDSVSQLVTEKTKVIIVPHMFGELVDIKALKKLIASDVFIIEDAAHSFGQKPSEEADAIIVSFGMDKVISSTRGGAVAVKDGRLAADISHLQKSSKELGKVTLFRLIFSPIFWTLATKVYYWGVGRITLGRILLYFATKIRLLGSIAVYLGEDEAKWPAELPARMSGVVARLGLHQLKKLQKLQMHRAGLVKLYSNGKDDKPMLRYPLQVQGIEREALLQEAKNQGIILGRWYDSILFTETATLGRYGYELGSAPVAEELAERVINLPTGVNVPKDDAEKIKELVNKYVGD